MFSAHFHKQVYFYLVSGIAITLPLYFKLNGLFLFLLFVNWVLEGGFKAKLTIAFKEKFFILCMFFYIWYAIELCFTKNIATGWFSVEKKSSFLFLPLIVLSRKNIFVSFIKTFFDCLAYATSVVILFCLMYAMFQYFKDNDIKHFVYHNLAGYIGQSAIYLSLLCMVSSSYLLTRSSIQEKQYLTVISVTILVAAVFLLASKTHIVAFSIVLIYILFNRFRKKRAVFFALVSIISVVFCTLLFTYNPVKTRFTDINFKTLHELNRKQFSDSMYFDGLSFRVLLLRFGNEIIRENNAYLIGVSPGDSQDILNNKMHAYNLYEGDSKTNKGYLSFNFHNQYMETFVATGIVGLSLLSLILISVLRMAYQHRSAFMFLSVFIFTVSLVTESMLERQVGVVSFCTIFSLFSIKK